MQLIYNLKYEHLLVKRGRGVAIRKDTGLKAADKYVKYFAKIC